MAIKYDSSDYAIYPEGKSLTEQEHTASCDINKMIRNAARGLDIRGSNHGTWKNNPDGSPGAHDDLTLDGVQFRIQKAEIEKSLASLAKENEFSPEELKHVPDHVQKKFGFKQKKAVQKPVPNANDQTNANTDVTPASKTEPKTNSTPPTS